MRYVFGRFEADPGKRVLLADGQPQPIGARAFDLLVALIQRSDRTVGSNELFDLVWPGLVVDACNLRQQIAALRKVVGAGALVNVPGRGYRFAAPVTPVFPSEEGGGAQQRSDSVADRSAGKPSIAVLPFAALSEDRSLGFLADGLVEDVSIRPAKSSCGREVARGCLCPRHFIADTWTLQESSCRAGGHGAGIRRSSERRLCRRAGSPACRSQPLHWPTA